MQKRTHSKEKKLEKQQLIIDLKHTESSTHYKIAHKRKTIEAIQQDLDSRDFYDPVNMDVHFPEKQIYRYKFVKNVKLTGLRKNILACLFSIHNTISLSHHEQVCLSGLCFERYFSHHQAT